MVMEIDLPEKFIKIKGVATIAIAKANKSEDEGNLN